MAWVVLDFLLKVNQEKARYEIVSLSRLKGSSNLSINATRLQLTVREPFAVQTGQDSLVYLTIYL